MRRISGLVLLGLGMFLITMAALVKWYAYPSLAVVPLDQDSVSVSSGPGMTYFSVADRVEKTDDLTSTLRVIGDVKAAEDHGDNVAVWDKSTVTTTSDGTVISAQTMRAAIDRRTGAAVTCCEANLDDVPVDYQGQVFKFPFNTQQTSYDWWDASLGQAVEIQFQGEDDIEGLATYRFSQTIQPTQVGTTDIPGGLLGEDPDQVLTAEEWYGNTRTLWVEPETGVVIKAEEQVNRTFRYDGTDRIVVTRGTTGFDDETIRANVEQYESDASKLYLARAIVPIAGLGLGLLSLIVGAIVVSSTSRSRRQPGVVEGRSAAGAR